MDNLEKVLAHVESGEVNWHAWHADVVTQARKELDDAIAEIKRLRMLTEWRPIETAPKDGTRIILGYKSGSESAEGYWMNDPNQNYWGGIGWYESDENIFHNLTCSPTHWLPLAEPPKK